MLGVHLEHVRREVPVRYPEETKSFFPRNCNCLKTSKPILSPGRLQQLSPPRVSEQFSPPPSPPHSFPSPGLPSPSSEGPGGVGQEVQGLGP